MLSIAVAVTAYDRPRHLQMCLARLENSLRSGSSLPVYVFQDRPAGRESRAWQHTTRIAARYPGVRLIVRDRAHHERNITGAIRELLQEFEALIVLEDDVCVSRDFIPYMVECLSRYAQATDVLSVCASQFGFPELQAQPEHTLLVRFFLRRGFGLWRRSWLAYDRECAGWQHLCQNAEALREFDIFGGSYLSDLLCRVIDQSEPVYDIRWYYALVARRAYSVMPTRSLVFDMGYTGGTHVRREGILRGAMWRRMAWRMGLEGSLYQHLYRGRAAHAGSQEALRGENVLPSTGLLHSPYESRDEQHARFATLLRRYQQLR